MAKTTYFNLNPDEYIKGLHYYPFAVNLGRYNGNCNTLDHPSYKICVPNKTKHLNLHDFNMITGINESKTIKHISC